MEDMDLRLEGAGVDDKDVIMNMYQYYVHDLSEFNDSLQVDSVGRFDTAFFESYFYEDNIIPLKITFENSIIGFIICTTGRKVDYVIQDTFILRNYRKRGFGRLALKQLFGLYQGRFGLDILIKNEPAKLFWENCLEGFGVKDVRSEVIEEDGDIVTRLFFDYRGSAHQ